MAGSRKYHPKTRNGCSNCKRRRVKCNLQAPQCHHCKRRGEECDFQHQNRSLPGSQASSVPDTSTGTGAGAGTGRSPSDSNSLTTISWSSPSPPLDQNQGSIPHTQLMWHFVTTTSATLALFDDTRWTWDREAPLQAETNAFLRHGLMAVSALHMCHLQPPSNRDEYQSVACQHYRQATVMFRSAVAEINRDNCIAVLAFSLLVSIFQLRIQPAPTRTTSPSPSGGTHLPAEEEAPLRQIIDALSALRGAYSLIRQLHPHLSQSHISGLFSRQRNVGFVPLDPTHQLAFSNLETLNQSSSSSSSSNQIACAEAILLLRRWFTTMIT